MKFLAQLSLEWILSVGLRIYIKIAVIQKRFTLPGFAEETEGVRGIPEQSFLSSDSAQAEQNTLDFSAAHTPVHLKVKNEISRQKNLVIGNIEQRNLTLFSQESEKLDAWADDLKVGLEREIKELDRSIKECRTKSKGAATLAEKLEYQKEQRTLEASRDKKRRELFERQDEIQIRRDSLISELETQLRQEIILTQLFYRMEGSVSSLEDTAIAPLEPTISKYSASGPMLGYLYQVRVALLWAARQSVLGDFSMNVETLDDINFTNDKDATVVLQTKHSINTPAALSDLSTELWKTLRVWMDGYASGEVAKDAARFLITTANVSAGTACAALTANDDKRDLDAAANLLKHAATTSTNATLKDTYNQFLAFPVDQQIKLLSSIYIVGGEPNAVDIVVV